METLKDRINRKREEVSDRTYDGQRENTDADMVNDLRDEVKRLASCVDDTNHRTNYHEVELNELNAALDIIIQAVTVLQEAVIENRKLKLMINHLAERLVRDEELIGIDDESEHYLGQDLTIMSCIEHHDDEFEALHVAHHDLGERVNKLDGELEQEFASIQSQIDRKLPKCE